jgi:MFS family permease
MYIHIVGTHFSINMDRSATSLLIYLLFLAVNLLINMDHGSIPAATTKISEDLQFSKVQLGALGSLVFIGLAVGSSVSGFVYTHFGTKSIISFFTMLTALSLILFPVSGTNHYLVYLARFMAGMFQVFLVVYFPVWIDVFAPDRWKTLWLTFLQLAVPLGVIFGYSLTSFMIRAFTV